MARPSLYPRCGMPSSMTSLPRGQLSLRLWSDLIIPSLGPPRKLKLDRGAQPCPAPASGALPRAQHLGGRRGVAVTPAPLADSACLPREGNSARGWVRLLAACPVSPRACHLTPRAPKSWPAEPQGASSGSLYPPPPRGPGPAFAAATAGFPALGLWASRLQQWFALPSQPDGPPLEPSAPRVAPEAWGPAEAPRTLCVWEGGQGWREPRRGREVRQQTPPCCWFLCADKGRQTWVIADRCESLGHPPSPPEPLFLHL